MKELNGYYRSIQKLLPCSGCQKRKLMQDIRYSVDSFLQDHPEANIEAVTAHFGTPQQIADTYTEEMPPLDLQKKLKIKKRIIAIIASTAAIALLIWLAYVAVVTCEELNDDPGYIFVNTHSSKQEAK